MSMPEPRSLAGVIPPLMTPIGPDGDLDLGSLDALVAFLLRSGVHGLFALGSSGETAYLTDRQRRVVVDRVLGQVAGQGRRLLGNGEYAAVVTAPFYANIQGDEIRRHFVDVAKALDVPILAYNIPVNVHQALDGDLLSQLAETDTIIGVKDSSGDLAALRRLLTRLGGDRKQVVLTGSEALLDVSLLAGADGAVAGLANVDPVAFVTLVRAHQAGDGAVVAAQQQRILQLVELFRPVDPATGLNATQLGAMKLALHQRGIIAHPNLSAAMSQPGQGQREYVAEVLAAADRLQPA
jgi:4-hydroxy-tetrahydrodipicolinate synthase